jgi:branched-chain amino acid transport system permease protein
VHRARPATIRRRPATDANGASAHDDFFPQFAQQLVNGLTLGAIYALIAIGYTMVYGIIGMINFAHGEIYMIGAYVGLVTSPRSASQPAIRCRSCSAPR